MSRSNVKGQGHQGQKTCLALPTPSGAYEWYALAANSMQQQQAGPFYGCQGVFCSCAVRQLYAGGKISACCLVVFNQINNTPQVSTIADDLARQHYLKIPILPSYFFGPPFKDLLLCNKGNNKLLIYMNNKNVQIS